jgi:hypothetical protein
LHANFWNAYDTKQLISQVKCPFMERSLVEKARKQTEQMEIIGENYHIWYDTITKDYDG